MPDDDTNTPDPGNGTPPDGGASGANTGGGDTLTRAEVEALIKDAQSKAFTAAFAEAKRRAGSSAAPPPKSGEPKPATGGEDRYARLLSQRDALDDVLTGRTVSVDQRRMLRDMMAKVDPDDAHTWAESVVSTFLTTSNTNTTNNNAAAGANGAAAAQQGANGAAPKPAPNAAPNAAVTNDQPIDVTKWDRTALSRFVLSKGGDPHDLSHPRNAKVWEEIAELYRQAGAQRRIVPTPPRR